VTPPAPNAAIQHLAGLAQGTYVLILCAPAACMLQVGGLGTFALQPGWYGYVGSALNRAGLAGRIRHHLRTAARPHWHIDYLRQVAALEEVWYVQSAMRYEHRWAAALCELPGAACPVRRFGASDCRCPTHLVHFLARPPGAAFSALVAADLVHGESIQVLRLTPLKTGDGEEG
jgi:Uri superfamily endonuclease